MLVHLLIKLDLKYKATKDQLNANGIMVLIDFDKEYREFNTINALDVLNNLENKLAITEKALELACEEIGRIEAKFGSAYIRANGYLLDYFKTEAKEILENE